MDVIYGSPPYAKSRAVSASAGRTRIWRNHHPLAVDGPVFEAPDRPTAVDRRSTVRRRASARGRKVGPLSLLKKSTGSVVAVVGRARGEGGRASNPYRERSEWRDLLLTYLTVSRLTFRVFLMIGSRVHRSAFVRQVQLNRAQRYQKCTKLISGTEHRPFYILKRKSATQPIHKLNI